MAEVGNEDQCVNLTCIVNGDTSVNSIANAIKNGKKKEEIRFMLKVADTSKADGHLNPGLPTESKEKIPVLVNGVHENNNLHDNNEIVTDHVNKQSSTPSSVKLEPFDSFTHGAINTNVPKFVTMEVNDDTNAMSKSATNLDDEIKSDVSQFLVEMIDALIGHNDQATDNSTIITSDHSEKTSKRSVRSSTRRRIPKKQDDEKSSELPPVPVEIKEKVPVPETPVLYQLGDLVWAYVPGHPLWPCMVVNDPIDTSCTKMQGSAKRFTRAYHVQFLGDSPEHSWIRETKVFPYTSPADYGNIIQDLTAKSKQVSKVPRLDIPVRLKDDWDSGIDEILEAAELNNDARLEKYVYDFRPYMKEFKHLYASRNKMLVYKDCKKLMKDILSMVCDSTSSICGQAANSGNSTNDIQSSNISTSLIGFEASANLKNVENLNRTCISLSSSNTCNVTKCSESNVTKCSETLAMQTFSSKSLIEAPCRMNRADSMFPEKVEKCLPGFSTSTTSEKFVSSGATYDSESTSAGSQLFSSQESNGSDDISFKWTDSVLCKRSESTSKSRAPLAANRQDKTDIKVKNKTCVHQMFKSSEINTTLPSTVDPVDSSNAEKVVAGPSRALGLTSTKVELSSSNVEATDTKYSGVPEQLLSSLCKKHFSQPEVASLSFQDASTSSTFDPASTHKSSSLNKSSTPMGDKRNEISVKIVDQTNNASAAKLSDYCTCTAFDIPRGLKKFHYSTRQLIQAVEDVIGGCKVGLASMKYGIPGTTLRDQLRPDRKVLVKHHNKCQLFPSGIGALTYRFVTHVKTFQNVSCLQLKSNGKDHSVQLATSSVPVVVLDRNDAIAKDLNTSMNTKLDLCGSSSKESAIAVTSNFSTNVVVARHQAEKAVSALTTISGLEQCESIQYPSCFSVESTSSVTSSSPANIPQGQQCQPVSIVKNTSTVVVSSFKEVHPSPSQTVRPVSTVRNIFTAMAPQTVESNSSQGSIVEAFSALKNASVAAPQTMQAFSPSSQTKQANLLQTKQVGTVISQSNQVIQGRAQTAAVVPPASNTFSFIIQSPPSEARINQTSTCNNSAKKTGVLNSFGKAAEFDSSASKTGIIASVAQPLAFHLSQEEVCEAWKNCKSKNLQTKDEGFLFLQHALSLVADGMDVDEVLGVFGLEDKAFQAFVEQFLPKKVEDGKCPPSSPVKTKESVLIQEDGKPQERKYTLTQLLQALDDLCYNPGHTTLAKIAATNNISQTTLKQCYMRNASIIKNLTKGEVSRSQRLFILSLNLHKLKISGRSFASEVSPPFQPDSCLSKHLNSATGASEQCRNVCSSQTTFESTNNDNDKAAKIKTALKTQQAKDNDADQTKRPGRRPSSYTANQLYSAMLEAYQSGCIRKSAKKYNVPLSTLHQNLMGRSKTKATCEDFLAYTTRKGLAFSMHVLSSWGWTLTLKEVRGYVNEFIKVAQDWPYEKHISDMFLLKMCHISSVICEAGTSFSVDTQIDPFKMAAFTNKLLSLLDGHGLKKLPSQVFLLQEFTNFKSESISEHQINYKVLGAFSASGEKSPPLVMFNSNCVWCSQIGAYPGSQYALSKDTELTPQIFEEWASRFLSSNSKRPIVILYDGQLASPLLKTVQKLYDSSCVVLKLPYATDSTEFQLPYKNVICNALDILKQDSITKNKDASTSDIILSINTFWSKALTSKVIQDTFSSSRFLSIRQEQTEQLEKKIRDKISMPVEFKAPSSTSKLSQKETLSLPALESISQGNKITESPSSTANLKKPTEQSPSEQVDTVTRRSARTPKPKVPIDSSYEVDLPDISPSPRKALKRQRSKSPVTSTPEKSSPRRSLARRSSRIRRRKQQALSLEDFESDDADISLSELFSSATKSSSAEGLKPTSDDSCVAEDTPPNNDVVIVTSDDDVTIASLQTLGKSRPKRLKIGAVPKTPTSVPAEASSVDQLSAFPVIPPQMPQKPSAKKSSSSLPPALPVVLPEPQKAKNTNKAKSKERKKNKDSETLEEERAEMFHSYYLKRRGPLQTERPNLTPEEIKDRIRQEWEFLSPSKRLKYGKRPPEEAEDSPKKRPRAKRPKKMSKPVDSPLQPTLFSCDACDAKFATKPLLNQHMKTCSKSKEKTPGAKSRPATNLTEGSKFKCDFQCKFCNDKFYSNKSLLIHMKFCTAKSRSPPKKSRFKVAFRGSETNRKRGSKSLTPVSKSSGVLNGTVKRKSLPNSTRRKKTLSEDDIPTPEGESPRKQSQNEAPAVTDPSKTTPESNALTPSRKDKGRKRPILGSSCKKENICVVCEEVGEKPLFMCSGGCCQSFHADCIEGEKPNTTEPFKCQNCISNSHPCFICHKGPNSDGSDLGKIKRCSVQNCGHSYHPSCLHSWKLSMIANLDENGLHDHNAFLHNFRCPLHNCATCASRFSNDPTTSYSAGCRMFKCLRCPTAYHVGDDCIAAGSTILPGFNIICPDHFEPLKTTPYHQQVHVSWCFSCSKGGELVCCESCPAAYHSKCVDMDKLPEGEWYCRDCLSRKKLLYGDIVWVKLGSYRWWPGEIIHPNDIPDNIRNLRHDVGEFVVNFFGSNDYFWLNKRRVFQYQEGDTGATTAQCSRGITSVFNKALRDASTKFEKLMSKRQKIEDVRIQKKRPQYKFIKVNKPVGSVQVYAADLSELPRCVCKRTDPSPCGSESECLNRMLMFECHPNFCLAGDKCQNQNFQKRDYPQSEVFKTSWGGFGLKTSVFIKKGDFVNEYVGELVDNEECMRRIEVAHKANVTNFYMLTLDKDRIIDAGPKGNWSRFMNHSCDPSCETQKWTVNGDARVGLFARRDIKPGEELTFNYNLDCLGNDKTPCVCGSKNCSGFIGVRPKPQLESKPSDGKVKKKRRRGEARDMPKHDDFCFRCRQVGTLVCCDVSRCQRAFCLSCLRLTKPPFGKWECPWHHCDFCGRRAQSFCHFCPNSFCASHVMNQLTLSVPNQYDCCTDHDPNVAEYEMEEAIAAVVASMLPPETWEEEGSSSQTTEEGCEEPETAETPKEDGEKPKRRRKPKEKDSEKKDEEKPKLSRSKKMSKDDSAVDTFQETPTHVKDDPSTLSHDSSTLNDEEMLSPETPASSQDDSLNVTESDLELELGPITSSPVKRKRLKRQYFRGSRKKKFKSRAQKNLLKADTSKISNEDDGSKKPKTESAIGSSVTIDLSEDNPTVAISNT